MPFLRIILLPLSTENQEMLIVGISVSFDYKSFFEILQQMNIQNVKTILSQMHTQARQYQMYSQTHGPNLPWCEWEAWLIGAPEGILTTRFCFVLCMQQFLGAAELALKQCFLSPKHFIIINDLSLTTFLQGRSVAKHRECRLKKQQEEHVKWYGRNCTEKM